MTPCTIWICWLQKSRGRSNVVLRIGHFRAIIKKTETVRARVCQRLTSVDVDWSVLFSFVFFWKSLCRKNIHCKHLCLSGHCWIINSRGLNSPVCRTWQTRAPRCWRPHPLCPQMYSARRRISNAPQHRPRDRRKLTKRRKVSCAM